MNSRTLIPRKLCASLMFDCLNKVNTCYTITGRVENTKNTNGGRSSEKTHAHQLMVMAALIRIRYSSHVNALKLAIYERQLYRIRAWTAMDHENRSPLEWKMSFHCEIQQFQFSTHWDRQLFLFKAGFLEVF